jgi:hypothetical protein
MKNKLLFNLLTPFATSNTEGKTFRNLLALIMVMVGMNGVVGQVAQFNFPSTNSLVVSTKDANVTVSNLSLSAGTIETNITTGTYFPNEPYIEESGGWTDTSQDLAKSFTFTITASSGYIFSITNVSFRGYATGSGPTAFGFTIGSTDIYSVNAPDSSIVAVNQSVSNQTGLTTATIKIKGWLNGSRTGSGGGAFRLDDLIINGSVSSVGGPNITQTGLLNTFISSAVSSPSAEQTFTIAGTTLTNDIVITAPTGYQVSTTSGSGFGSSVTLTPTSGTVATTTIYARFNPTALSDQVGGNISISTTGATTQNVAVSGEVTNLSAGAIAFIAFQGASLDLYRIVALNDIPNNTRIWFTDKSWDGGTLSFFSGEGNNVWTNTTGSAIAAGTVIQFDAAGGATLGTGGLNSGLGSAGEQLFAYQGTLTSPTFVAGYTSGTVITTGATTGTATYVPVGLTSGTNFVALGGTTFGSSYVTAATHNRSLADMRSHIHNTANLTTGDTSNPTYVSWPTYTFNISNDWIGANGNWNTAANWSFATVPSSIDHVTISSGSPVLDVDYTLPVGKTLTLSGTGGLTINPGKILTIAGTADFGGNVVTFKSDATGTAILGTLTGTLTNATNVKVERFIPSGKRAFRLLSPAVTTTTFISGNWQGQTHITGGLGTTGLGFDATETNNPSMFTYNNQAAQGVSGWTPIANTNATNLTAGVGYRVLIRGDRNVNLTVPSANGMNAAITLSATGTLKTGPVTLNASSTPSINNTTNSITDGYSLVGNPYQSPVDWNAVTRTDIGATYWAWDPNMGTSTQRGRYVSFNGSTNSVLDGAGSPLSYVGQFIQPGQAFFVKNTTLGTEATLTFQEAHKATTSANVFRTANTPSLGVALYDPNELAIGGYPIDAMKAVFSSEYTNELGLGDATKLEAAGENIAWFRNNTKLAIDAAAPVTTSDELVMKTLRLGANKNYTFKIQTTNFDTALTPYLVDTFLNTQTEIATSQAFLASFATTSNQASYSEDRFKIVFQTSALSAEDFVKNIKLYPNPAKAGGSFYVDGITEATVSVYNVVGQTIPVTVMSQGNAIQVTPSASLSNGVYLVSITTQGITKQVKWIVE